MQYTEFNEYQQIIQSLKQKSMSNCNKFYQIQKQGFQDNQDERQKQIYKKFLDKEKKIEPIEQIFAELISDTKSPKKQQNIIKLLIGQDYLIVFRNILCNSGKRIKRSGAKSIGEFEIVQKWISKNESKDPQRQTDVSLNKQTQHIFHKKQQVQDQIQEESLEKDQLKTSVYLQSYQNRKHMKHIYSKYRGSNAYYPSENQSSFESVGWIKKNSYQIKRLFDKNMKSKSGLQQIFNVFQTVYLQNQIISNINQFKVRVFFFGKNIRLDLFIDKKIKVKELIEYAIQNYMKNEKTDKQLMKYPDIVQAYELRILEDEDDDYLPDMNFEALNKSKKFTDYNVNQVVFCQRMGFKLEVSQQQDSRQQDLDILKQCQSILNAKDENIKVVEILIEEEDIRTRICVNQQKTINDIMKIVQHKFNFNMKEFLVYENSHDQEETQNTEDDEQEMTLNVNMPINQLQTSSLILHRKRFYDVPQQTQRIINIDLLVDDKEHERKIDEMKIFNSKYFEYQVLKINNRYNKIDKTISVGNGCITIKNSKQQQQDGIIMRLFNCVFHFEKTYKSKKYQINQIHSIQKLSANHFVIYLKKNKKIIRKTYELQQNDLIQFMNHIQYLQQQNELQQRVF